MLYESASTADHICQLNDWDRCSIPMYALEVGLKHRQLDVISFYLRSRENCKYQKLLWCQKNVNRYGQCYLKNTRFQLAASCLSEAECFKRDKSLTQFLENVSLFHVSGVSYFKSKSTFRAVSCPPCHTQF